MGKGAAQQRFVAADHLRRRLNSSVRLLVVTAEASNQVQRKGDPSERERQQNGR
jgi:hypothetical protein